MKPFFLVASVVFSLFLAGCALRPYQSPIQQGILLKQDQISQLQVGMTQNQVTYLFGTPNLTDPYHPNTWYYLYTLEEDYQPRVQHELVVNFDASGKVSSFEEK